MDNLNDNNLNENIDGTNPEQQNESLKIIHISLHDGTWVEEQFFNQVLQLICESIPALELEKVYTTKMLCGKSFWKSLEKGKCIKAGKCIAHAVARGDLPLRFAGTTKANSQQYKLK